MNNVLKIGEFCGLAFLVMLTGVICLMIFRQMRLDYINTAMILWLASACLVIGCWIQDVKNLIDSWIRLLKEIGGLHTWN